MVSIPFWVQFHAYHSHCKVKRAFAVEKSGIRIHKKKIKVILQSLNNTGWSKKKIML